jgi:hypothetical protein
MLDPIEKLKREIAQVQVQIDASRNLTKQRQEKMNQLALLTADQLFIAVDNGSDVVVCGVSNECPSQAFRLHFTPTKDRIARIQRNLESGSVSFSLAVGGSLSFTVTEYDLEDKETSFVIRTFASVADADDWANQRKTERVNR